MNEIDYEMELIAKPYSCFSFEDKQTWNLEDAKNLAEDEIKYSGTNLWSELLFEVIDEFIKQDAEYDAELQAKEAAEQNFMQEEYFK